MKKFFAVIALCGLSITAAQAEYWSFPSIGAVLTKTNGTIGLSVGSVTPTNPNPAGTTWVPCPGNFIYMHENADGVDTPPKILNQMLAVALVAFNKKTAVRIEFSRNTSGSCYANQFMAYS